MADSNERENRQLTNPQDDERGPIDDGSFTGRWADRYQREKTSLPLFSSDKEQKELKKLNEDREAAARDALA